MDSIRAQVLSPGFLIGLGCGACIVFMLRSKQNKASSAAAAAPTTNGLGPCVEEEGPCEDGSGDYKMVLVVRTDLKMGKGKIAAQCSHAAVAAYKQARRWHPEALRHWEEGGQAKVTLKVAGEKELRALAEAGRSHGLGVSLVRDAGRTQIAAGSTTVLGVGPALSDKIDEITGHLSLL